MVLVLVLVRQTNLFKEAALDDNIVGANVRSRVLQKHAHIVSATLFYAQFGVNKNGQCNLRRNSYFHLIMTSSLSFRTAIERFNSDGLAALQPSVLPAGTCTLEQLQEQVKGPRGRLVVGTLQSNRQSVTGTFLFSINGTVVLTWSADAVDMQLAAVAGPVKIVTIKTSSSKVWVHLLRFVWKNASTYEELRRLLYPFTARGADGYKSSGTSFSMLKFGRMVRKGVGSPLWHGHLSAVVGLDFVLRYCGFVPAHGAHGDDPAGNVNRLQIIAQTCPDGQAVHDIPRWFAAYTVKYLLNDFVQNKCAPLKGISAETQSFVQYWVTYAVIKKECKEQQQSAIPVTGRALNAFIDHAHPAVALYWVTKTAGTDRYWVPRTRANDPMIYVGFWKRAADIVYKRALCTYATDICGAAMGPSSGDARMEWGSWLNRSYGNVWFDRGNRRGYVPIPSAKLMSHKEMPRATFQEMREIAKTMVSNGTSFPVKGGMFTRIAVQRMHHLMCVVRPPPQFLDSLFEHVTSAALCIQRYRLTKLRLTGATVLVQAMAALTDVDLSSNNNVHHFCLSAHGMQKSLFDCAYASFAPDADLEGEVLHLLAQNSSGAIYIDVSCGRFAAISSMLCKSTRLYKVAIPALTPAGEVVPDFLSPPGYIITGTPIFLDPKIALAIHLAAAVGDRHTSAIKRCTQAAALIARFSRVNPAVSTLIALQVYSSFVPDNTGIIDTERYGNRALQVLANLLQPNVETLAAMLPHPSSSVNPSTTALHASIRHVLAAQAGGEINLGGTPVSHAGTDRQHLYNCLDQNLTKYHVPTVVEELVHTRAAQAGMAMTAVISRKWKDATDPLTVKAPPEIITMIVAFLFASVCGAAVNDSAIGWPASTQLATFDRAAKHVVGLFHH